MKIPEALVSKIKARKCVLFLGAGASVSSGGPTGSELAEYIRDHVVQDDNDYDEDFLLYIETLLTSEKASRKAIEKGIKERFESLKPSLGYEKLSCLPWKAIYTTNYDHLIELAYQKQNFYKIVKILSGNQYEMLTHNEIPLYKLHGCISDIYDVSKPLVMSLSDFQKNRENNKEAIRRLTEDLIDTILFVGYSFQDQVVTELINEIRNSSRWASIGEKYALVLSCSKKDILRCNAYGITPVEGDFETFFEKISAINEQDDSNRLLALRKSLSLNCGKTIVEFEPRAKVLVDTYFDYFDPNETYRKDPDFFYRGGRPDWGDIVSNLDIPRTFRCIDRKNGTSAKSNQDGLTMLMEKFVFSPEPKFAKIMITGPAAVGKTTLLYRLCHDLINRGVLSLIYKDVGDYRAGLLAEIYKCNHNNPFIIFIDAAATLGLQVSNMYKEIIDKGLPITVVLATRTNEWEIFLDKNTKRILDKVDYVISLEDKLEEYQSVQLVDRLLTLGILQISAERSREDLTKIFKETSHLMVSLMETIQNTTFDKAISSEYDALSEIGKDVYGIISLVNRHNLPFKWECLQRTLHMLYGIDWETFIEKFIKVEGKGVIKEEGIDPNYYYVCRHGLIAEKIVLMHYKENRKNELSCLKAIISSINRGTYEEVFVGRLLQILISSMGDLGYGFEEALELLDEGINIVFDPSFLIQLKGQFLLDNNDPELALRCFEKNINGKSRNIMYSLHSAGMAHFAIAKSEKIGSGRRLIELTKAKNIFLDGIERYKDNPFFYKSLFQVLIQKCKDGICVETDKKTANDIVGKAEIYLVESDPSEISEFTSMRNQVVSFGLYE